MKKTNWVLLIGIFLISLSVGIAVFQKMNRFSPSQFNELDWRDLNEFDYVTGDAPEKLKKQDGQDIRIPGFMVPLEDNQKKVTEFLLVPSPQACIHVPPPPPNQMVLIEMDESADAEAMFGPIWVYGKFNIHSKRHQYGEASFTMKGYKVEPYK